ncbi:MAG TPA: type I glyceraldehyde-3-phosphate dehydrogenase [Candidatus Nanoarchaeia archaeon]|nr:type I glyceraldehyde-3-phosphate dehydrogenase [Candidatus Nanoarchaeia archaeon]
MVRIAINGFGRIGRAVFRRAIEKNLNVVAINDVHDVHNVANLLRFDSVYGRYNKKVKVVGNYLKIDGKMILVTSDRDPEKLPWKKLGVDVVIEATGVFANREGASKHLIAGAKKVIITASAKDVDSTIVIGVNDKVLKKEHKIISMASCTTNCAAPIVKVLDDKFGLVKGYITTVHAYTSDQALLDSPHKDWRRGRAAAINLVPTTTGAAKAVCIVIPSLKGKLDGIAIRAPVACGSITDFALVLKKSVTVEEVNNAVKDASKKISEVLEYSEEELVSTDIIGNTHSTIFDSKLTRVNGNLVKVFSWYDNEYGYSCRIVDLLKKL